MQQKMLTLMLRILLGFGAAALINPNVLASNTYPNKQQHSFTEVRLMTPFTTGGINQDLVIETKVKGSCWATSSQDQARPNTWRCKASNKTYDPCFINTVRHSNKVLCFESPWNSKAVEITLDSPLPANRSKSFSKKSAQPWALELANGNHCTLMTGPSLTLGGLETTYICKQATIIGKIDRSTPIWTVMYAKDNHLFATQTQVRTAWY